MPESTLKERIRDDMNAARRRQDKDRARLLSTILADVRNREIEVGHELDDAEAVEVLARAVKMRNEAAEQMASRPELADKERAEVEALKEYLPPQLSEEEIRRMVVEAVDAGASNIGAVMGRVMPQLKGRADGREVNRIVREVLDSRAAGD
ncbi:MAG: GatB/YqeY domain-containing protein [Gemmatimonadota bacterium]